MTDVAKIAASLSEAQWKPIATAPEGVTILVCDTKAGMPWTIAKVQSSGGLFSYAGCAREEIDFKPAYWIERDIDGNPFYIPTPARKALRAHFLANSPGDASEKP